MAISDTITSMYENVENVYDVLELAGADLTNVDKNIENLKQSWEERLLYFLANGTDVVWNNWLPKVTGSGTTLSINNTIQAPMKIVYGGNTYQYSTTGYNLFKTPYNESSTTKNGITFTINEDGSIHVEGTATAKTLFALRNKDKILDLSVGETYTFVASGLGTINSTIWLDTYTTGGDFLGRWALTSTYYYATAVAQERDTSPAIYITVENGATVNTDIKVWLYKGSYDAEKDYEPYTNGASPNPDYPQDIQVVSGNNTIKVEGKNLFDKDSVTESKRLDGTGSLYDDELYLTSDFIKVKPSTTYSYTISDDSLGSRCYCFYDIDKNFISRTFIFYSKKNVSISTTSETYYIRIADAKTINYFMLNEGTTALPYEPYQSQTYPINIGNIELCKIGTYQDKIANSTGKNLFNPSVAVYNCNVSNGLITITTNSTDVYIQGAYVYSEANKFLTLGAGSYYIKSTNPNVRITCYGDGESLDTARNQPITLNSTTNFGGIRVRSSSSLQNVAFGIMLSTENIDFEPYSNGRKVWYLNKQIGKVVLNGSEDWQSASSVVSGTSRFYYDNSSVHLGRTTEIDIFTISNSFRGISWDSIYSGDTTTRNGVANYQNDSAGSVGRIVIRIDNTYASSVATFKTWLGTNQPIVYYVKETPTYEEITDSTLIYQLEETKKSYNNQTSISQVNNDLPFILDVTALGN